MCFLNDKDLKTIKTESRNIEMEKKQYFVKKKKHQDDFIRPLST